MKQSVIFDLDGTLWDALTPLVESWNVAMKKNNVDYIFDEEKMRSLMGLTPIETCPVAFNHSSLEEGLKLFKLALEEEIPYLAKHPGKLYEGEEEVLKKLHEKYSLYVVSNADKGYIENYMNAYDMRRYFDGFIQAGDTNLPKWQNILYIKEKENIDEIIYVGDTKKDEEETLKAGQIFIHASYGFGKIKDTKYKNI